MSAGQHLVDADAAAQHGPLLQRHAGEDVAGLPGVDADAGRRLVEQAVDDVHLGLERRQRLEALAQLHLGAGALGPPVVAVDAVAHEQHGEPLGERRAATPRTAVARRPSAGSDSSQGRAIVTPTPRRNVRRETSPAARGCGRSAVGRACHSPIGHEVVATALGAELRAGDDALDQAAEAVVVGGELRPHLVDRAARRTACSVRPRA